MSNLRITLWMEFMKTRKSGVFWGSLGFFVFIPVMMGLITIVQLHPELADKLGLIGTKASLFGFGAPNWTNYFTLLNQAFAGVGLVGTGFVASWSFGREFSDHTIKDLLVVPVKRVWIVMAKLIVITVWSVLLALVFLISALILAWMIGLPGFSVAVLFRELGIFSMIVVLMVPLLAPVSFLSSYSRGIILPLAFVILTLILANFSGLLGLGPYFPWAIPGLYGIASGADGMQLIPASYVIVVFAGILGLGGTIATWRWADQK